MVGVFAIYLAVGLALSTVVEFEIDPIEGISRTTARCIAYAVIVLLWPIVMMKTI